MSSAVPYLPPVLDTINQIVTSKTIGTDAAQPDQSSVRTVERDRVAAFVAV